MPYINLPPTVSEMFWDLDRRIRSLETAFRFNMPNVDFTTYEPTNPRIGDLYYNTAVPEITFWDGTQWVVVASGGTIGPLTTVNATLKSTGTQPTYTGNPVQVTAQSVGETLTAFAKVTGTTVSDWGTGQLYFELPSGFPTFAATVIANGYILDNGNTYTIFGVLAQGDNKMYLWHPSSNGGSDITDYNSPATLDSTSVMVLNGIAII